MPPRKKILPLRAAKEIKKSEDDTSTAGAREKENTSQGTSSASPAKRRMFKDHVGIKFIAKTKKQTIARPFNFTSRGKSKKEHLQEILEKYDETIDLTTPERKPRRSLSCGNLKDLTSTIKPEVARSNPNKKLPLFSIKDEKRGESVSPIRHGRPRIMYAQNSSIIAYETDDIPVLKTLSFENMSEDILKNEEEGIQVPPLAPAENFSMTQETEKKMPFLKPLSFEQMSEKTKGNEGADSQIPHLIAAKQPRSIPVRVIDRNKSAAKPFGFQKMHQQIKEGDADTQRSRPMAAEQYRTRGSDKKQTAVVKPFTHRQTRSQKKEKENGDTENGEQRQQQYIPKKITRRRQELL